MDGAHEHGTTDAWDRLAAAARPLDRDAATAVRRRTVPWWLLRVATPALVTALLVLEYVLSDLAATACTVTDPCLPIPVASLLEGVQLGAVVALWCVPRSGAPLVVLGAGSYWAGVYLGDGDAGTAAAVACLAQAGVAAGLVAWLRWARRAPLPQQGRVVPLPDAGRTRLVSTGVGTVELAVLLSVLAALGLVGWWALLDARTDAREARAVVTEVEVVAVDDLDWVADVRVPGGGVVAVGLWDLEGVEPGVRLPARVDAGAEPVHVSLLSQPVEHDGWLVLAGAAAALGLGLGAHRGGALLARRRLLRRGGPVWSLSGGADDAVVVLPALGLAAPFARTLPGDDLLAAVGLLRQALDDETAAGSAQEQEAEERADREDFAAAWRGERRPEVDDEPLDGEVPQLLLVGDPRPGGTVVAVLEDAVLAPFAPLGPMSPWRAAEVAAEFDVAPHDHDRDPDAVPGGRADGDDCPDEEGLPGRPVEPAPVGAALHGPDGRLDEVQLRQSPWRHLWWLTALVLLGPWVLATDWVWPSEPGEELDWWEAAGLFAAALGVGSAGVHRARSRVVLDRSGVHVRDGWSTVSVAWSTTAGSRVLGDDVLVALGLDDHGVPEVVGGTVPAGLRADAVAAVAERWRLDEAARAVPADAPDPEVVSAATEVGELAAVAGLLDRAEQEDGRRRRLDPVLAAVTVLYVLAAAATVAWPYVV